MSFLAPSWLFLLALTVPLLLLHARRQRRIEVASVSVWRRIEPMSRRNRHLHWPRLSALLLLQLAIVILSALALAQPRFGSEPPADHTIFVLDMSGSMRANDVAPSRYGAAVAELDRRIAAIADEGNGRVSLIAAGATPQLTLARRSAADIGANERPAGPTDGASDLAAALDWVNSIARAGERTRLVVLTDADGGLPEGFAAGHPAIAVERLVFAAPGTADAGLTATVTPLDPAAGLWRVAGRVTVSGEMTAPQAVDIRFGPDNAEGDLDWGTLELKETDDQAAGSGIRTFSFTGDMTFPGAGRLQLVIADDAGPSDNAVQFVLQSAPRLLRVLIVGADTPEIVRAFQALGNVEISVAASLPPRESRFDLVVANDVTLDRHPAANLLTFSGGHIADEAAPGPLGGGYVTHWRDDHTLSRDVDWSAIAMPRYYARAVLPGADILLESGSDPLVQARTTPSGRDVRVAIDPVRSGWADDQSFPVFVSRVAEWTGIDAGALIARPCLAGAACALEARETQATITGPDGKPVDIRGGDEPKFTPALAGFYRVESAAGVRTVAVNPPAGEFSAGPSSGAAFAGHVPPVKSWWWIAAIVLLLLAAEGWLAGRGAERFLVAANLKPGAYHAGRRRALLAARVAAIAAIAAALAAIPVPLREADSTLVAVYAGGGTPMAAGTLLRLADRVGGSGGGLVTSGPETRIANDIEAETPQDRVAMEGASPVDVARPLDVALAMLPPDRPARVVLAAAGDEPASGLKQAAAEMARRGVALDLLPQGVGLADGVLLDRVVVPAKANSGDTYPLDAFIYSRARGSAHVTVYQDGEVATAQDMALGAGFNRFEAVIAAKDAGPSLVEVAVEIPDDLNEVNNSNGAVTEIAGPAPVLVIAPDRAAGRYFGQALSMQGLATSLIEPKAAPRKLEDWLEYDVVVLMNVPALDLGIERLEALKAAVRDRGLGLLILGGENSFGPGGYYQSPLEDISPLSSRVPQDAPEGALIFVLDRSGSMQANVGAVTRLDIAKAATLNAAALLHEESRLGIVAFDSEAYEVLPLQDRRDMDAAAAALEPIQPGGGTRLFNAFDNAIGALEKVDSGVKHIVVMTDGLIEPVDFTELLDRAKAADITVSTVAFGSSAITDMLAAIADRGGGTYHKTNDFRALPSILAQETLTMADSPVKEGETPVFWVNRRASFLAGLPDMLPAVANHVDTTLKPGAVMHLDLIDDRGEHMPLMASWRLGSGHVLALATQGAGAGTREWLRMPEYPLLWAQIVRGFVPNALGPGLHPSLARDGDAIVVTADLIDDTGRPMSRQAVSASFAEPAGGRDIALAETAPGRYEGRLQALDAGTYRVAVKAGSVSREASIHVGYPARLNYGRADPAALTEASAATGGRVLAGIEEVPVAGMMWTAQSRWRPWILLALGLFLADLAIRHGGVLAALAFPWRRSSPRRGPINMEMAPGAAGGA